MPDCVCDIRMLPMMLSKGVIVLILDFILLTISLDILHSWTYIDDERHWYLIWTFNGRYRSIEDSVEPKLDSLLSQRMTKPTKWHVRPAKTQISLGICSVWSETLLSAQEVAENPSFLHADSEDSDQTGLMPRLIWVVSGRTCHFVSFVMHWLNFIFIENYGYICYILETVFKEWICLPLQRGATRFRGKICIIYSYNSYIS